MSLTTEQLEARRSTIGGSDIGAILGENKYKTAYEVWEEKVEGKAVDLSRNKSVVIGNLLEKPLITKYETIETSISGGSKNFIHRDHDFLTANVDGITLSDFPKVVEIKTASVFNKDSWGNSGSQIVPSSYYAQVAHYMMVTECEKADIFVGFIDENVIGDVLCEIVRSGELIEPTYFFKIVEKMETRIYRFYRDEEMEDLILEAAISFYENHMRPWIEHGIKNPPPMDFSNKGFQECIKKKYLIQEESQIKLPDEFIKIKDKYLSNMVQTFCYLCCSERLVLEHMRYYILS